MALPKYDPTQTHQPAVVTEFFQHPEEGFLQYQPSTMRILGRGPGQAPIKQPIKLYGPFRGTNQPNVPTCSEPVPGRNAGCNKWAGCPFKALPGVGPMQLVIEHNGTVSNAHCYDYYETIDDRGRPLTNRHYGLDGWKINTSRTTIDVRGHMPITNQLGQKIGQSVNIWQKEVADLGPPWWPMMKKKGLPLPPAAEVYPELVDPDGEVEKSNTPGADLQPSVSRNGRGKRTTSTSRRKRSATVSSKPSLDAAQEG